MRLTPNSWGSSRLREYNPCHEPAGSSKGGQFCPHPGTPLPRDVTRAGITSARTPEDVEHHRPNRVVAQEMRRLEADLKRIPGVRGVQVVPSMGQWDGGSEFSWAVGYIGNGEAKKLLADVGRAWNQDAVLLLRRPKAGEQPDSAFEFMFDVPVPVAKRTELAKVLGARDFGGWTWYKRNGRTTLRLVNVPQWDAMVQRGERSADESNAAHRRSSMRLGAFLSRNGLPFRVRELRAKADPMERSGAHSYEAVLSGRG